MALMSWRREWVGGIGRRDLRRSMGWWWWRTLLVGRDGGRGKNGLLKLGGQKEGLGVCSSGGDGGSSGVTQSRSSREIWKPITEQPEVLESDIGLESGSKHHELR